MTSHSILHAVQSYGQSIWDLGLHLLDHPFQLPGDKPVLWFYRRCMGISDASSVWLPFQMLNLYPYDHVIIKNAVMIFNTIVNLMPLSYIAQSLMVWQQSLLQSHHSCGWLSRLFSVLQSLDLHQYLSEMHQVPMHDLEHGLQNYLMAQFLQKLGPAFDPTHGSHSELALQSQQFFWQHQPPYLYKYAGQLSVMRLCHGAWPLAVRDHNMPLEQRVCSSYHMSIETEEHLLLDCPYLDLMRPDFDLDFSLRLPNFMVTNDAKAMSSYINHVWRWAQG